jgi:hypothetical protein
MRKTTFNDNSAVTNYAPCKNCDQRECGCHSGCSKYFAYKLEQKLVKEQMQYHKELEREASF